MVRKEAALQSLSLAPVRLSRVEDYQPEAADAWQV